MAIAINSANISSSTVGSASSLTFGNTVPSGSDRVLVVVCGTRENNSPNREITGVTYNGVSMTELRPDEETGQGVYNAIYYLDDDDDAGAFDGSSHDVVISTNNTCEDIYGTAISFTGVDQTTNFEANNGGNGSSNTIVNISATSTSDNAWGIGGMTKDDNDALSTTTGTERSNQVGGGSSNAVATTGPVTPAGSVTVGFDVGGGANETYAISIGVLKPATAVTDLDVDVNDAITITENVDPELNNFINVSDQLNITEDVTADAPFELSVSDQLNITENIDTELNSFIDVSDQITVSEDVVMDMSDYDISVNDSITITENVDRELNNFIDVNDAITITENIEMDMSDYDISVSDQITVSENVDTELNSFIDVSDQITVSEQVIGDMQDYDISISDAVTITEDITLLQSIGNIDISDTITVSEDVTLLVDPKNIDVSDAVTITEYANVSIASDIVYRDKINPYTATHNYSNKTSHTATHSKSKKSGVFTPTHNARKKLYD